MTKLENLFEFLKKAWLIGVPILGLLTTVFGWTFLLLENSPIVGEITTVLLVITIAYACIIGVFIMLIDLYIDFQNRRKGDKK